MSDPEQQNEGTDALATAEPAEVVAEASAVETPPPASDDIVVVATSPAEMEVAQQSLIKSIAAKVEQMRADATEAEQNLALAAKRKWATAPFRKALNLAQGRVAYYERIKAALEAGYIIMPDLPGATIAVRTSKPRPRARRHESRYYGQRLPTAESDGSPVGEGRYVEPNLKYDRWDYTSKDGSGREETRHVAVAEAFDDEFQFPVKFVKPQVFDETSKAMLLKIFDEIGIIGAGSNKPGQRLAATATVGDPIVLGRVVRYEGKQRKSCAFLITWWLDPRTL